MAGYTRQSSANIVTGEIIRAAPLNLEFDTLQTAFSAGSGHTHDGTTGSGPKILLTGANGVSGILPIANGGTGSSTLAGAGLVTPSDTQTLTNKTFTDNSTFFQDNSDNTKKLQFELSGITTATTRTLTIPDESGTVVLTDAVQTLVNKTLTSPTINNASIVNPSILLKDLATTFQDNVDDTKRMVFQLSGITTGTTRTLTIPDAESTIVLESNTATLTNKTFTDSTTFFQDNSDTTKKMQFQLSGLTTATTRTLTPPDASTTLYGMSNILGTVSQSGGIPTGAIYETGTNANGTYTKFADGTMICSATSTTGLTASSAAGAVFTTSSASLTFPAAFIATPVVMAGSVYITGGGGWASVSTVIPTTTACRISVWSHVNTHQAYPSYIAVGRWF